MVMAINPPTYGNTFDAFLAKAKAIGAAEAASSSGYHPTSTYGSQSTPYPPSGTYGAAATYTVAVGRDGLNFTPPIVNAKPGDYIDFTL